MVTFLKVLGSLLRIDNSQEKKSKEDGKSDLREDLALSSRAQGKSARTTGSVPGRSELRCSGQELGTKDYGPQG